MRISFQALDRQRRPVQDLRSDSVTILDNGIEVRNASGFYRAADLPLSVVLMLDASDSMIRNFAAQQVTSSTFVRPLIRSSDDRVMLVAFRNTIEFAYWMTGDAQDLTSWIRQIKVGGLTALYDALVSTSDRIATTDAAASRRAIILFSDGEDTNSYHVLDDAIACTVRNDVAVYTITVRDKHPNEHGEAALKRIADASGGRSFVLRSRTDLSATMEEIALELRTLYFVTYPPPQSDGTFHSLKVMPRMNDISIQSRAGYVAPSSRHD